MCHTMHFLSHILVVCTLLWVSFNSDWLILGEEMAGCFALFVFLVSRDCYVTLPRDKTGLSAVCECVFS